MKRKIVLSQSTAVVLASTLLTSACSNVYRMPEVASASPAQIAVLEVVLDGNEFVTVSEVDGRFRGLGTIPRYELASGSRTITTRLVKAGGAIADPLKLRFTALAGETYRLQYAIRSKDVLSGTWTAWIVNMRDGKTVSEIVK